MNVIHTRGSRKASHTEHCRKPSNWTHNQFELLWVRLLPKTKTKTKKYGMIFLLSFVRSFVLFFVLVLLSRCVCFSYDGWCGFFSVAFCIYTYLATGSTLSHCFKKKALKQLYVVSTLYRLCIAVSVARTRFHLLKTRHSVLSSESECDMADNSLL